MSLLTPVREYVDALVHPSAQRDALTAARHRAFIAPRLLGSFAALAALPVYLALRGVPSALELAVFGWLVLPILIAHFLSRTGRYEGAHVLSSLALTGLVTAVAVRTGGITSFAAIWLVVVPLEASLSASRRVVALAAILALGAAASLLLLDAAALLPPPAAADQAHGALAALGIVSAALYATGLALGVEWLAATSAWLLQAEEDRYRFLARNMTEAVSRHDRNGAVLFIAPAIEPILNTRAADLLGHGLFDRVHIADRPAYLTALADAATHGQARSVEFRVRRDGKPPSDAAVHYVWLEMRCRPLEGGSELVGVLRDVGERKAHERALDEARVEADRANLAKSRFLATMTHELRTPLNIVIGFSEMLLNEKQMMIDATRRRDYAQHINASGHHLLSVVNGILDMSKIETGNFEITPEPFEPAQVIAHCCDMMALKVREAGLELVLRVPDVLPEVVVDKRALNQILFNLLSNAVKFTDRGGTITIAARVEAPFLSIVVEDTGVGIGEEDLPRIGDPFFQAHASYDRRHDGTGLGLSIVKGLVRLHGGDFTIRSRVGQGTSITVRLPLDCGGGRVAATTGMRARHPGAMMVRADVPERKSA